MTERKNRNVARQAMEDLMSQGKLGKLEEYVADDFVDHEAPLPGSPGGRDGIAFMVRAFRAGFPDLHIEIEHETADGEYVTLHTRWSGTHKGTFMGIPPTNKRVDFETMDLVKVHKGKIAEHWGVTDQAGLMQQLGVGSPAPEAPLAAA